MDTDTEPLFRRQVTHRLADRLYGDVLVKPKFSHLCISIMLLLWVVGAAYVAFEFEWENHQRISGFIDEDESQNLIVMLQIPIVDREYLAVGKNYPITIADMPTAEFLHIEIIKIYDELTVSPDSRPLLTKSGGLYVLAEARLLSKKVKFFKFDFALTSGTPIHFVLPTGKQNLIQWLGLEKNNKEGDRHVQ